LAKADLRANVFYAGGHSAERSDDESLFRRHAHLPTQFLGSSEAAPLPERVKTQ